MRQGWSQRRRGNQLPGERHGMPRSPGTVERGQIQSCVFPCDAPTNCQLMEPKPQLRRVRPRSHSEARGYGVGNGVLGRALRHSTDERKTWLSRPTLRADVVTRRGTHATSGIHERPCRHRTHRRRVRSRPSCRRARSVGRTALRDDESTCSSTMQRRNWWPRTGG